MNACEYNRDLMMQRLDGTLNLVEERTLEAHLRECAACVRENGLLRAADGLLRAVGAPEVAEEEWASVLVKIIPASEEGTRAMTLAASASEPPQVSDDEWSEVWSGIEREALLGRREAIEPAGIVRAARRRSVWSEITIGAAAAALLAVGVYLILQGTMQPVVTPPPAVADAVTVGKGYAYTTINTGADEPVYVITAAGSIESAAVSTSSGYMHSAAENSVIEIVPHDFTKEKPIEIPRQGRIE